VKKNGDSNDDSGELLFFEDFYFLFISKTKKDSSLIQNAKFNLN